MQPVDMRPFPERITAELAIIKSQLETLAGRLTRLEHNLASLMQRFEQLSQIQGTMALAQLDDDLDMEPGVAVWTPVEVDDE